MNYDAMPEYDSRKHCKVFHETGVVCWNESECASAGCNHLVDNNRALEKHVAQLQSEGCSIVIGSQPLSALRRKP